MYLQVLFFNHFNMLSTTYNNNSSFFLEEGMNLKVSTNEILIDVFDLLSTNSNPNLYIAKKSQFPPDFFYVHSGELNSPEINFFFFNFNVFHI